MRHDKDHSFLALWRTWWRRWASVLSLTSLSLLVGPAPSFAAGTIEFGRDIAPILSDNCYHCHGPDEKARKGKLRFDSKEGDPAQ